MEAYKHRFDEFLREADFAARFDQFQAFLVAIEYLD